MFKMDMKAMLTKLLYIYKRWKLSLFKIQFNHYFFAILDTFKFVQDVPKNSFLESEQPLLWFNFYIFGHFQSCIIFKFVFIILHANTVIQELLKICGFF